MLDVQTNIYGDSNVVSAKTTKSGCGCGGGSVSTIKMNPMTQNQLKIVEAVERINKRMNATYKTKNRIFM